MDQRLSLKLGQRLVLTPTLQQAIKLLQLSKLELIDHITHELEENPVLEEAVLENPLPELQDTDKSKQANDYKEPTMETDLPEESPYNVELDWSLYNHGDRWDKSSQEDLSKESPWYENVLSTKQSLQDYLLWQLHLTLDREEDLEIGETIIGNIDDDAYLRIPVEEIASELSIDFKPVEEILAIIQTFDPPGVGSRNLQECLSIQLKELSEPHPLAETIVRDHLKQLENKNYHQISHMVKRPVEEVYDAARIISGLEPKPGRLFSTDKPEYIIPDIYIYKVGEDYQITLNDEGMPKLRINNYYRKLMNDSSTSSNTREYIQKKFSSALWLVKSIHQRQKTICRVTESIVNIQRDFLDYGIDKLKPMILRDVAEDIGMHESTVSRVTTRKYAQTPQGLFELKFFFNSGIGKDIGPSMASASVQNLIQRLVDNENSLLPLSDQKIASELRKAHGLVIARRTVAKYRKIMKILPANNRKKSCSKSVSSQPKEGGTI